MIGGDCRLLQAERGPVPLPPYPFPQTGRGSPANDVRILRDTSIRLPDPADCSRIELFIGVKN